MPTLTASLHASPAQAALTVSAATGVLAVSICPRPCFRERFGRGRVIVASALAATLLWVAAAAGTRAGMAGGRACPAGVAGRGRACHRDGLARPGDSSPRSAQGDGTVCGGQ